jgi:hypothetical protein
MDGSRSDTLAVLRYGGTELQRSVSLDRGTVPGRCVNRFKFYYSWRVLNDYGKLNVRRANAVNEAVHRQSER